jgi:hypothetical protein
MRFQKPKAVTLLILSVFFHGCKTAGKDIKVYIHAGDVGVSRDNGKEIIPHNLLSGQMGCFYWEDIEYLSIRVRSLDGVDK